MTKKKDKYEELAGEFVNEAELEEEMDQEDLNIKNEESSHFEEEESAAIDPEELEKKE